MAGFRRACGLCLVLAWITGCGDESPPKTYPISGTVNLDGKPMPEGMIYLKMPQAGAVSSFPVTAGKFDGTALEGEHRVEVCLYRSRIIDGGEVKENVLPKRYHLESTFKGTVTAKGPNQFEFNVTSK